MRHSNSSKATSILLAGIMAATILSGCTTSTPSSSAPAATATPEPTPTPDPVYIAAPHTAGAEAPTEYLEPTFYENENGPDVSVTYLGVVQIGDQYFKDSNNNQTLDTFEDWRLSTEERMGDLLANMTEDQRIGLLRNVLMAKPLSGVTEEVYNEDGTVKFDMFITGEVGETAEGGVFDPANAGAVADAAPAFPADSIINTSVRSAVVRMDTDVEVGALFNNTLNQVAEWDAVNSGETMIPYMLLSNPMNAGYPTSLGFGAALADGDMSLLEEFVEMDREVWDAKGIHQMYGPQIDVITDPRWSRNFQTYTESPELMSDIAVTLVEGYQSGTDGTQVGDVSLIMKHFPGDGAALNGFESHFYMGQWRPYETENSLADYQLPPFQAAIDAGLTGIMPGYSRPTLDETISVPQSYMGLNVNVEEVANGFNTTILTDLLRDTMGFTGYINSDSNIITGQPFGVEDLSETERIALAVNAGNDVIGDGFASTVDMTTTIEAVTTGLVTPEAFDRATTTRMTSWLDLGMFDSPYRDPAQSKAVGEELAAGRQANKEAFHHDSVVLMKNSDAVLPLNDTSKTVYLESFTDKGENEDNIAAWTTAIEEAGFTIVKDAAQADIAILDVVPGGVNNNNEHLHEINLVEGKDIPHVERDTGELSGDTVEVTSLQDVDDIAKVAATVHGNGGIVIASIDISSPWILTKLEPHVDGLIGSFSTTADARMDILTGAYLPTGKLPVTMPASEGVIAIDENNFCASPNDVPGYDKDQYMDAAVLAASPSGSYTYKDADGNLYGFGYGLTMEPKEAVVSTETEETTTETTETTTVEGPAALALNYEADPALLEGDWVLTGAYTAAYGMLTVKENAVFLSVEKDIETNELVDEGAYIHADATNMAAKMTFDPAISENEYNCSSAWDDWSTVNIIGEGNAEYFGANKFRIRDDDEGVFFEEVTGVAADELLDVIGVNAEGNLIVGYSDDGIVTDDEATWTYAYIFSKA